MSSIIDLSKNLDKLHLWSNTLGEIRHGERVIAPADLPKELKRVYDELLTVEDDFGLSSYLAEYDGQYGISLEAVYDRDLVGAFGSYKNLLEIAQIKADLLATKFPAYKVLFGTDTLKYGNGTADSQLIIFMPWNISKVNYEEVETILGYIAYQ
jgi:hypothetical protein